MILMTDQNRFSIVWNGRLGSGSRRLCSATLCSPDERSHPPPPSALPGSLVVLLSWSSWQAVQTASEMNKATSHAAEPYFCLGLASLSKDAATNFFNGTFWHLIRHFFYLIISLNLTFIGQNSTLFRGTLEKMLLILHEVSPRSHFESPNLCQKVLLEGCGRCCVPSIGSAVALWQPPTKVRHYSARPTALE